VHPAAVFVAGDIFVNDRAYEVGRPFVRFVQL
jgi:hypothetical protein